MKEGIPLQSLCYYLCISAMYLLTVDLKYSLIEFKCGLWFKKTHTAEGGLGAAFKEEVKLSVPS